MIYYHWQFIETRAKPHCGGSCDPLQDHDGMLSFKKFFIWLVIFGCIGSLCGGWGPLSSCRAQASRRRVWVQWLLLFQSVGSRPWAQGLWHLGSVDPCPMESSWTKDGSCVGRCTLNPQTTREARGVIFKGVLSLLCMVEQVFPLIGQIWSMCDAQWGEMGKPRGREEFFYVWCWKLSFQVDCGCCIESQRQSFGWSRTERLYCFARQKVRRVLMPSKLCVPTWRRQWEVYSHCSEGTGSAPGHPVDGLVVR